jgi:toxin ParE1/3/4
MALYDYIAERGAPIAAMAYVGRLEARCLSLGDFPEQGRQRDDVRQGLRLLGFERRQ